MSEEIYEIFLKSREDFSLEISISTSWSRIKMFFTPNGNKRNGKEISKVV
jgi:hypothetical protein